MNFYNEIDPAAAAWLRELIKQGHIADGVVDERSIVDLEPDELRQFRQCHFFAGIGGWSYALRLAGVPDDFPVWTGSCPCQPFSAAGKQRAADDERHLWPAFFNLIKQCRPGIVFGEQVAAIAGYAWWDQVATDVESEGYSAAAADIGAHSVGAPHIRQRLYWVANADSQQRRTAQGQPDAGADGRDDVGRRGAVCGVGDAERKRLGRHGADQAEIRWDGSGRPVTKTSAHDWGGVVWLPCSDGKARPTQSGIQPLAHGVSARVVRLRGYGNAIVPQLAATFIRAAL